MPQRSSSSRETPIHNPSPTSQMVRSGFVTLSEEFISTADGLYPYVTVHTRPHSVIVLPVRGDGTWLVTREWRHPIKRHVYSFPGGLVDEKETPLQSGRRELLEETGFEAEHIQLLGTCFPLPGLLYQTMSVVLARNIRYVQEPRTDAVEDISFDFYSIEQLRTLFRTCSDVDAMGLAALAMYWINKIDTSVES